MRLFIKQKAAAVRTIELGQPLQALTDVLDYTSVRIFVRWQDRLLGSFDIANHRQPIGVARLRQAIAHHLTVKVIEPERNLSNDLIWSNAVAALTAAYTPEEIEPPASWLVDLGEPLRELTDVLDYKQVSVMVTWKSRYLGSVDIPNYYRPVSVMRLREAIASSLGLKLLEPGREISSDGRWASAIAKLAEQLIPGEASDILPDDRLPTHIPVSIVVATLDRPEDLRICLRSLVAQETVRRLEIVVVDNNPSSGLTPPVVAEFPGVVLVNEPRKGLSYARNTGFVASTGDIAIATDDDVTAPPDWVEKLVAPFARDDVMIVTGNVLPLELETPSQQFFEIYGGLGRGFKRFEVNGDWFESFKKRAVPTWELGATANAAFRATIFSDPRIGMMYEAIGPGMPSGVGEDTYLFYKTLKAGYTLVYEPDAYVWHKHRRDMASLRRQLYNYSKGGIAYHLTTFFRDGDLRGLMRIFVELPRAYKWRIKERLHGRSDYPLPLILLEIRGNLAGAWALWRSIQRVQREGRSQPYIPVSQRPTLEQSRPTIELRQYAKVDAHKPSATQAEV